MTETVQQNEKLINSCKFSEVNKYQSKFNNYYDVGLKLSYLSSNIDPRTELSIEIGDYRATLKQMFKPNLITDVFLLTTRTVVGLMDEIRVVATIIVGYTPLVGVVCVGEAEAWISGQEKKNYTY